MKNKLKNSKGITLVALGVTIVVLFILAGVGIKSAVGQNGIISKAEKEKDSIQKDIEQAEIKKNQLLDEMKGELVNPILPDIQEQAQVGVKVTGTNKTYTDSKGKTAIIPVGFKVSEVAKEQNIDTGLVIKDELGNEWVWVPVKNPSELYEAKSDTITQGGVNVTTPNYSKSEILTGKTRGTPNSTSYREPGILTDATYTDGKQEYRTQAGFTTLQDMAENLVKDYNEMIASLEKYHGFYIGRYELSAQGEKKKGTSGNQTWYTAYKQAKNIIPNEAKGKVETRMVWSLQWDATCKWIANNGDRKDINNSSSWGNYNNSTPPANISGAGSRQVTGLSEKWKANNIYDLAGNCWEWTQEAYSTYIRAGRGGSFYDSGSDAPASDRYNLGPSNSSAYYSSRSTLYIK